MARKKVASKSIVNGDNGEPTGVEFDFENGTKLTLSFDDLSASMLRRLAAHGALQKIGDSYSGLGDNIKSAAEAAESVIKGLMAGDWSIRGEGDGGMLLEALIEYFDGKMPEDKVRAKFKEFDADEKAKLRKHKAIKAIMARLALERAKAQAEDAPDLEL